MKKITSFIKDNILLGMAVIIPIAVVGVVLSGTIKKLMDATAPITKNISFGSPLIETAMVILILVVGLGFLFFICGLILKTYLGNSFKNWLDKKVMSHVPFYDTIKNLTGQVTGLKEGNYSVVEVTIGEKSDVILGILTETLADGRCVIYCPFSPLISIGQMHIVSEQSIERLDMSLKDFTDVITKIGFESAKIQEKYKSTK